MLSIVLAWDQRRQLAVGAGIVRKSRVLQDGDNHGDLCWAIFTFYQALCHLISHLHYAAVVKGVDTFHILFLLMRKQSLQQ